jgi:hypothetical protein
MNPDNGQIEKGPKQPFYIISPRCLHQFCPNFWRIFFKCPLILAINFIVAVGPHHGAVELLAVQDDPVHGQGRKASPDHQKI